MSISSRLTQALEQALGQEASEELMALLETGAADMAELRHAMHLGFEKTRADIAERIEARFADLLKWSFVFWVGAVTTIAVLFRTLR